VKKLGLVTPYQADVQAKIVENYTGIGGVDWGEHGEAFGGCEEY